MFSQNSPPWHIHLGWPWMAWCMMYSVYKLNEQSDNTQPCHTSFPILNQSVVSRKLLTVASWPSYRFLRRQVRWSGIPISKNFPQFIVIHTVKGFSIVDETEVDVFLKFPCFLYDAIWSLIPLPFLNPACISGSIRKFCFFFFPQQKLNTARYFSNVWFIKTTFLIQLSQT